MAAIDQAREAFLALSPVDQIMLFAELETELNLKIGKTGLASFMMQPHPLGHAKAQPTLREVEVQHVVGTLAKAGGNISEAARQLGIFRSSLQRKLVKYSEPSEPTATEKIDVSVPSDSWLAKASEADVERAIVEALDRAPTLDKPMAQLGPAGAGFAPPATHVGVVRPRWRGPQMTIAEAIVSVLQGRPALDSGAIHTLVLEIMPQAKKSSLLTILSTLRRDGRIFEKERTKTGIVYALAAPKPSAEVVIKVRSMLSGVDSRVPTYGLKGVLPDASPVRVKQPSIGVKLLSAERKTERRTRRTKAEIEEDKVNKSEKKEEASSRSSESDSDDHPSIYFSQIGKHALLTKEQEIELAKQLEETEVTAWRYLFEQREILQMVCKIAGKSIGQIRSWRHESSGERNVEPAGEPSEPSEPSDEWTASALRPKGELEPMNPSEVEKLGPVGLRSVDMDRVALDAVLLELVRVRKLALERIESRRSSGEASSPSQPRLEPYDWWDAAPFAKGKEIIDRLSQLYREATRIREEFAHRNLRLVVSMAKRYKYAMMPLADLIQEGNLGLIHAIPRFDHTRNMRFSTYACWWIRHDITRAVDDKAKTVRVPVHLSQQIRDARKAEARLTIELGRTPEPAEIEKAIKMVPGKLAKLSHCLIGAAKSLDVPIGDNGDATHLEMIVDPQNEDDGQTAVTELMDEELRVQLARFVERLTPIERDILAKRFGLGNEDEHQLEKIGKQYYLSRERIRQIQAVAIQKLRNAFKRTHRGRPGLSK